MHMIKLSSILKGAGLMIGSVVAPVVLPAIGGAIASARVAAISGVGTTNTATIGGSLGKVIAGKDNPEKMYTTEEAAEKLGISTYSLRRHIRAGKINVRIIPGKKGYFLTESDLAEFLDPNKKNIRNEEINATTVDFGTGVQIIKEGLRENRITPEFVEETIRGKELECEGLRLQLKKIELEKSNDSEELEKKKIDVEIAINLLQLEIQVYKAALT